MRADALGFFWRDEPPPPRVKKEAIKRTPPDPVWLRQDYLPYLKEALEFNVDLFNDNELTQAGQEWIFTGKKHELIFDIELYPNYLLIAFKSRTNGKLVYFERTWDSDFDARKLEWVFRNFLIVGFNSNNYDIPIASLALAGCSTEALFGASTDIIVNEIASWIVLRRFKVKAIECDHIDLIEVAPLFASLKIYGGRMHSQRMQDLPFVPGTMLTDNQIAITRYYCINDLDTTIDLRNTLEEELDLRSVLSNEYGMDLMSKSDAQIAEAVIGHEIEKLNGKRPQRPNIEPGTAYRYNVPSFVQFRTPMMNSILDKIRNTPFVVSEFGNIGIPDDLKMGIRIADGVYRLGIGGLHSSEKSTAHYSDDKYDLIDRDVTSYYPFIILNQGLYPDHLGPNFLIVYRSLVERRLDAKRSGNKKIANSLKITINGSFGKLGNMYSILYSPQLLIQVTITGQLSLLMLIERLELAGIQVASANTDGIVIKCHKSQRDIMDTIVKQWETETSFETEATRYAALYSRDVNNYIAIKHPEDVKPGDDRIKAKGAFAKTGLSKNPANAVCVSAIESFLLDGIPIDHTVKTCDDIKKFLNVRTVKGGAVKDGEYLGKSIRWYYSTAAEGEIVYAKSGNKVARSEGAMPLMELPKATPQDIDYDWYIGETNKILKQIGYPV